MRTVEITSPELPGATFRRYAALREFAAERLQYENACQAHARGGDRQTFADELAGLGYEPDEIAEHLAAGPAYRMQEMFLAAASAALFA